MSRRILLKDDPVSRGHLSAGRRVRYRRKFPPIGRSDVIIPENLALRGRVVRFFHAPFSLVMIFKTSRLRRAEGGTIRPAAKPSRMTDRLFQVHYTEIGRQPNTDFTSGILVRFTRCLRRGFKAAPTCVPSLLPIGV